VGADDLSVGFVVCAFQKNKTKNKKHTVVCVCVCVCVFWVNSQAELLIYRGFQWHGALNGWCTGSSSFTVASFFIVLFRFALCLFVACYYSFKSKFLYFLCNICMW
jgi:hypothetical protein